MNNKSDTTKTFGTANKYILLGLITIVGIATISTGTLSSITADYFYGKSCDNSSTINVKCFGAVGDGVTDDSAAIQSAVNALGNGSKVLLFPQGTYILQSTIYFNNSAGNLIRGTGIGGSNGLTASVNATKIQWGNWAVSSPMFWFSDGSSDNTITGLWFKNGSEAIRFRKISSGNAPKYQHITGNLFDNQSIASVWVGYPIGDNSDGDYDLYAFDHNFYSDVPTGTSYVSSVVLNVCSNGYRASFDKESWTNGNVSIKGINWKVLSVRDSLFTNMTNNGHAADAGAGKTLNYSIEMQRTTGCAGGGNLVLDNILSENGRLLDTTSYGIWGTSPTSSTQVRLNDITFNLASTYTSANVTAVRHRYSIFATGITSTEKININSTQLNITTIQPDTVASTKVNFNPTDDTGAVVGAVNRLNPGN